MSTASDWLAILGFALVLASWFGMFFRVCCDRPGSPSAKYTTFLGSRVFGLKFGRSGFGPVASYIKRYGMDDWAWLGIGGFILFALATAQVWSP